MAGGGEADIGSCAEGAVAVGSWGRLLLNVLLLAQQGVHRDLLSRAEMV